MAKKIGQKTKTAMACLEPEPLSANLTGLLPAVQIGAEAATALTATIDKTYGLVLHDLRQWDRDEFEIRIPIIQEDQGKMLSTTDRFSVEITLGPGEITVTGP